ncbi:phage baseplate assembly protein V [Moraxella catarrhalis]|uniref:phage baseplate assembly protein V n=1 Tax=Moraxella catarrhalis TaxID=480 RepID=UPI00128AE52F|nr:phage baseplate assembly protein V [Moraxella catarrhalis]MPY07414.1 phage baseplate assembly protein V [Moraxella catarrhalis]
MNYAHNNLSATLQFGEVSEIDPKSHKIKVALGALDGMVSDWLPVITMEAGGNQFYALPDVGATCVCLMNAGGDGGVVLGVIYNDQDTPPTNNGELWVKRFSNDTVISHNRQNGQIIVETSGDVIIKSAKQVTLNTPSTIITGNVRVQGKLTASGDVVGGGVSLKSHTHGGVARGNSRTGTP